MDSSVVQAMQTVIDRGWPLIVGVFSAVFSWCLAKKSTNKVANKVAKAIMMMFRDEISTGISILEDYIKSPTSTMLMPNESFGTHLLSSDVIHAVLEKAKNKKTVVGFPQDEFLKHLTNYYMHICVRVNQVIKAKEPLQKYCNDVTKDLLDPAKGVLAMVEEIIKSFEPKACGGITKVFRGRWKATMLIASLLFSLGVTADDVYYRWNSSGNISISGSSSSYFNFKKGASLSLTVKGSGRLSFHANGEGFYYINSDAPENTTSLPYNIDYNVDFHGDGEHTIRWYTLNTTQSYGDPHGYMHSVTWKGTSIQYAALIEWDANGGMCGTTVSHVQHGGAVNTLPSATRTGFILDGWYTKKDGGVKISNSYTVSSDTVFYAHWTANKYTITFNANGGEGGTSKSLAYDTTLGSLPEATRYDFDFGGWWTEANGGSAISSSTKVTGATTYYAHWIDPIPELTGTVTDDMVSEALSGSADSKITAKITTPSSYNEYRQWINDKGLSHKMAKASPNAWLSYALDAPELMAKVTALANEDIVIESFEPSSATTGTFNLVVNIADAEIGEDATSARLAEVFGVDGATELNESAFSSEGLTVTLERTTDGKAKAIVTPIGTPPTFFMRVKIK